MVIEGLIGGGLYTLDSDAEVREAPPLSLRLNPNLAPTHSDRLGLAPLSNFSFPLPFGTSLGRNRLVKAPSTGWYASHGGVGFGGREEESNTWLIGLTREAL